MQRHAKREKRSEVRRLKRILAGLFVHVLLQNIRDAVIMYGPVCVYTETSTSQTPWDIQAVITSRRSQCTWICNFVLAQTYYSRKQNENWMKGLMSTSTN